LPQAVVENALAAYHANRPEALQISVHAAKAWYEETTRVVHVSIDDVGVKKQKRHRKQPQGAEAPPVSPPDAEMPTRKPRQFVHNTMAQVQIPTGWYTARGP